MTTQRHKKAMNLAIDHLLNEDERDALDAHLDQSPDDALLWQRMRKVDRMLRSAPQVEAPDGFSARLMAAIAAGRQPSSDTRYGLGLAFGLLLVAFTAIPALGVALFAAGRMLADMTALQVFLNSLIVILNGLSRMLTDLTRLAASILVDYPFAPAFGLIMLPLTALWGRMMWTLMTRYQQVTYRIPVRVVAS